MKDKYHQLIQIKSTVVYTQEFQTLTTSLGFNDVTKCSRFYHNLKDEIKKIIIIADRVSTFLELINQTIEFDQMFFQQSHREKHESEFASSIFFTQSHKYQNYDENHLFNKNNISSNFSITFKNPLTEIEKEYRKRNHLCMYCVDSEHNVENCPLLKKKEQNKLSPSTINRNLGSHVNHINVNINVESTLIYSIFKRSTFVSFTSKN